MDRHAREHNTSGRKCAKTTARKVLLGEFAVGTAGGVDDLARYIGSRVNDGKAAPLSFTPSTLTCQQLVLFNFVHAKYPSGNSFAKVFTARLEDGALFGQIGQRIVTDTTMACLLMCWTGMFMRSILASAQYWHLHDDLFQMLDRIGLARNDSMSMLMSRLDGTRGDSAPFPECATSAETVGTFMLQTFRHLVQQKKNTTCCRAQAPRAVSPRQLDWISQCLQPDAAKVVTPNITSKMFPNQMNIDTTSNSCKFWSRSVLRPHGQTLLTSIFNALHEWCTSRLSRPHWGMYRNQHHQ